jgi:hypothetical protein
LRAVRPPQWLTFYCNKLANDVLAAIVQEKPEDFNGPNQDITRSNGAVKTKARRCRVGLKVR